MATKKAATKKAASTAVAKKRPAKKIPVKAPARKAPAKSGSAKTAAESSGSKSATPNGAGRKYSPAASKSVEREMKEMHEGKLMMGRSGKKVTNPKQAIAIGLSEARRSGAKVPPPPKGK